MITIILLIIMKSINMKKPYKYWTYESCKEEALKYLTKKEFNKHSPSAYVISTKNKWIKEICIHMNPLSHEKNYWSYEMCKNAAFECKTRIEFKKKYAYAYRLAIKNGWINEITDHMIILRRINGYWSYDNCKKEALKFNNRHDFNKYSYGAYHASIINDWLEDVCSHMIVIGNIKKRLIYVYEFSDNHAYVGLTYNFNERNNSHLNVNSSKRLSEVSKYIKKTNLIPISKQLTEYINIRDAVFFENHYYNIYKNNGWIMLNKVKTGGLGGNKWNKKNSINELHKYNNILELKENNLFLYNKIIKNNWS